MVVEARGARNQSDKNHG